MKQLTIRIDDPETERRLEKIAETDGLSLNRVVVRMIREAAGTADHRPRKKEWLADFCGVMSDDEADELDRAVEAFGSIDEELWS